MEHVINKKRGLMKMKKIIMTIAIITVVLGGGYHEHNYIRPNCEVTQVCDGIVSAIDETGEVWDFKASGYKVGDIIDLKMYDNNTSAYIYDDIVKGIK